MSITPDQFCDLLQARDLDAIRAALEADPELLGRPESRLGWTPLRWAVCHGCNGRGDHLRSVVDLLLEFIPAVSLHEAALLDRADLAQAALEAGAAVDAVDHDGRTALHLAAERGSYGVAEVLLDHGADPDRRSHDGGLAIAQAAHPGPLKESEARDVIELLRQRGATIDLHTAATIGDVDAVAAWLASRPDTLNGRDEGGCTALFHAAHNLRLEVVDLLLSHGADVNVGATDGQTPLSTAVDHSWDTGGPAVVQRLLQAEPAIDMVTAAQLNDRQRIEQLAAGDPSAVEADRHGYSALFLGAGAGAAEAVTALLRLGADPDRPDPYQGSTALHQAAAWGQAAVCRALLTHGADRSVRNHSGRTAAEEARQRGRAQLAELIEGWPSNSSSQ